MRKLLFIIFIITLAFFLFAWSYQKPEKLTYGTSFSRFHSEELKLNWKETYLAILNDLGVRNFRFSAHWPLTEPEEGKFNFTELDFQIKEARKVGASVILAVGRRLPGWPECHEPAWVKDLSKEEKQKKILAYIRKVVERYKGYENILYWQVENEPYLAFFSRSACGELDEEFLKKEIALVKELDARPVILTDSGEFSTWHNAYVQSDVFGTSIYLYIWNRILGPIRYPIMPAFFRIKHNIIKILFKDKPALVIELSAEPWLLQPIVDTPIDVQLSRMGVDKFNEMIDFSSKTGFDTFYLWGAEWWYWMKLNGHPEFWERAKNLISTTTPVSSGPNFSEKIIYESAQSSVGIQVFSGDHLVKQGSGIVISSDGLIATVADLAVSNGVYQVFYDDKILRGVAVAKDINKNLLLIKSENVYSKVADLSHTDYREGQSVTLVGKIIDLAKLSIFSQEGVANLIKDKVYVLGTEAGNNLSGAEALDEDGKLIGISYLRSGKINLATVASIQNFFREYIEKLNKN